MLPSPSCLEVFGISLGAEAREVKNFVRENKREVGIVIIEISRSVRAFVVRSQKNSWDARS